MPIKERCTACKRYVDYGKRCPCGGRVGASVFLTCKIRGKRHVKNLKTCSLSRAKVEEHRWLLELHEGVEDTAKTLDEVFEAYKRKLLAEKRPYYSLSKLFLKRMIDFWGDMEAKALKPAQIRQFQTYLLEAGYSEAYADRHIAVGKAAWGYSLDLPNPFKRVDLYNPDNTLVRFLTSDEESRLLEAALKAHRNAPPIYDWIVLAIHTGLRETNIMRLHVSEIDFDENAIRLTQKGKRRHAIAMNSVVRELLLARVVEAPRSGWLYPNRLTGKPYTRLDKSFASAKKAAKITKPFRFHDLRHHFARNVLLATGNLLLTSNLLGHSNPITTTKYAHMILKDQQKAVDLLVPEQPKDIIQDSPLDPEANKVLN